MGSTISKVPVISWKWVKTYFLEITGFAGFTGTFCGFPELKMSSLCECRSYYKISSSQGNYNQYSPREYNSPSQGQQITSTALLPSGPFSLSLSPHLKFILKLKYCGLDTVPHNSQFFNRNKDLY